ncbi:hypothetical protein CROQUDRAFT_44499 [Cronartium quercuum f. sp. fusiforme G11]|uniref:Uncharacterized protein n=1 Tax=Cronartium quercuum f. sp. fusiforme G11 TaxID=708437 RepID=A0A9P6TBJ5_9BASI|nr:hypothetical protein CROQUDRAFT_44499 [Cronartium quercuum f. sp. fusiforme G11]
MGKISQPPKLGINLDMVICICPKCPRVKHEDKDSVLVPGVWVHSGTQRKHIAKLTAQPKDSSIMMMLAEDFQKMACLEAPHTSNTPSDADTDTHSDSQDTAGGSDVSFVDFVCNF